MLKNNPQLSVFEDSLKYSFEKLSIMQEWARRDRKVIETVLNQNSFILLATTDDSVTERPNTIVDDGFGETVHKKVKENDQGWDDDKSFDFEDDFDRK